MATHTDAVRKPRNWDKAVASAYLRLIGQTQKQAARSAGIGARTLERYEVSDWWPEACLEARGRWMQTLDQECRATVMGAIKGGDATIAARFLERIDRTLAPRQRHEITGFEGAPIETRHTHLYMPDNGRNVAPSSNGASANGGDPARRKDRKATSGAAGGVSRHKR